LSGGLLRIDMSVGGLLLENSHRVVCVAPVGAGAELGDCSLVVELPEWVYGLGVAGVRLAALYLAARSFRDSAAWASYHLEALLNGTWLSYEATLRLAREARVRPLELGEVDSVEYWRGLARALLALDKVRPVVVRIEPPTGRVERERLRHLLEGTTVTKAGRRRRSQGLIGKLGGVKLAPWLYVVPRVKLQELRKALEGRAHVEVALDTSTINLIKTGETRRYGELGIELYRPV